MTLLIAAGVYLLVLMFTFAMCRAAAQGDAVSEAQVRQSDRRLQLDQGDAYARAIERDGLDAILAPYVVEEVR